MSAAHSDDVVLCKFHWSPRDLRLSHYINVSYGTNPVCWRGIIRGSIFHLNQGVPTGLAGEGSLVRKVTTLEQHATGRTSRYVPM